LPTTEDQEGSEEEDEEEEALGFEARDEMTFVGRAFSGVGCDVVACGFCLASGPFK